MRLLIAKVYRQSSRSPSRLKKKGTSGLKCRGRVLSQLHQPPSPVLHRGTNFNAEETRRRKKNTRKMQRAEQEPKSAAQFSKSRAYLVLRHSGRKKSSQQTVTLGRESSRNRAKEPSFRFLGGTRLHSESRGLGPAKGPYFDQGEGKNSIWEMPVRWCKRRRPGGCFYGHGARKSRKSPMKRDDRGSSSASGGISPLPKDRPRRRGKNMPPAGGSFGRKRGKEVMDSGFHTLGYDGGYEGNQVTVLPNSRFPKGRWIGGLVEVMGGAFRKGLPTNRPAALDKSPEPKGGKSKVGELGKNSLGRGSVANHGKHSF